MYAKTSQYAGGKKNKKLNGTWSKYYEILSVLGELRFKWLN